MSKPLDLSFVRYVQRCKRLAAARAREGDAYAYAGDLRFRARLARIRPVVLALEAALRHFQNEGKKRLLVDAVAVGRTQFPAVAEVVARAAQGLGIAAPTTYVAGSVVVHDLLALGSIGDPILIIPAGLLDRMDAAELLATVAQGCGRVHNQHTPLLTALYFLESTDSLVGRWAARPATMALSTWAERAAVTADRASLLVTQDGSAVARALVKRVGSLKQLAQDIDVAAVMKAIDDGAPVPPEGQHIEPALWQGLRARILALRAFEHSNFFRGGLAAPPPLPAGQVPLSLQACDITVAQILAGQT